MTSEVILEARLSCWVYVVCLVPIVAALLKLKAGRPHDFEDVLGIIKNPHVHVDLDYLWSWADQLGLHSELSYVLHAADTGR